MSPTKTKTKGILDDVGTELRDNPPKILASTAQKFGQARAKKQKVAILLSKARRAGANVPRPPGRNLK